MQYQPHIIVSSTDLERLEALLDALPPSARREIKSLLSQLERAEVREPGLMPRNVVTMNSVVRFAIDNRELCLTLVYPYDINGRNRISVFAPVGSALLGRSVGAEVQCTRPGGDVDNLRILQVTAQADEPESLICRAE